MFTCTYYVSHSVTCMQIKSNCLSTTSPTCRRLWLECESYFFVDFFVVKYTADLINFQLKLILNIISWELVKKDFEVNFRSCCIQFSIWPSQESAVQLTPSWSATYLVLYWMVNYPGSYLVTMLLLNYWQLSGCASHNVSLFISIVSETIKYELMILTCEKFSFESFTVSEWKCRDGGGISH